MKRPAGKQVTAADVNAALADRFAPKEWATVFNVGNATGYGAGETRRADALALNLWPSRGMELHGFEVKVSRHDWMRELRDPAKSNAIQQYCDRWWIAVGDAGVVQDGELPPTWGLFVLDGAKLVMRVEAPKLEAKPWPRPFIAAMMRASTDGVVPRVALEALVEQRAEERRKVERSMTEIQYERQRDELSDLKTKLEACKAASGIDVTAQYEWRAKLKDPKLLGEAVKFVLTHGLDAEHLQGMMNLLDATRRELAAAMECARQLPVIGEPEKPEAAE